MYKPNLIPASLSRPFPIQNSSSSEMMPLTWEIMKRVLMFQLEKDFLWNKYVL
jgi:hypothetical protein